MASQRFTFRSSLPRKAATAFQVSSDTLTLDWAGTYSQGLPYVGDYNATFSLGVPEASTWTMMILGVAGVGVALRRRRRAGLTPATAFR